METNKELFEKRRKYVNQEFQQKVKGSNMSNPKKSKLMKLLWKQAKRKFK